MGLVCPGHVSRWDLGYVSRMRWMLGQTTCTTSDLPGVWLTSFEAGDVSHLRSPISLRTLSLVFTRICILKVLRAVIGRPAYMVVNSKPLRRLRFLITVHEQV